MKIDIITCHTPHNYGAMLQAYGLQTYLENKKNEVEIINYAPNIYLEEQKLSYIGNPRFKKNIFLSMGYILYQIPYRIQRHRIFNSFKNKYLHITETRYDSFESLYFYPPIADQYICGSDQIWNTRGSRGFNPVFYLGFVKDPQKRNSYAASMGADFPLSPRVEGDIISHINNLDLISVRETLTQNLLQPYINKDVFHVLDPVFLLDKEKWIELAKCSKGIPPNKYILIYPMGESSITFEYADRLSKKTGLPIYCITASKKKNRIVSKYFMPTVPGFLQLFNNAQYVITDSFHGTSFSIIFRKNFWSCQIARNNHRIISLLESIGLLDRYISAGAEAHMDVSPLNYKNAEFALDKKIDYSKAFIQKILNKS